MTGAPLRIAMSWILTIFCACACRERAAEDGEVLDEEIDEAAVDRAPAGDDAVAGHARRLHAEIGRAVFDEGVEFLERAFVEQDLEPLARGQLAAGVLGLDALLAAAHMGRGAAPFELADDVVHGLPLALRLVSPRVAGANRPRRAANLHSLAGGATAPERHTSPAAASVRLTA